MSVVDRVYTPAELKERTIELKSEEFVVDGLVPKQRLSLVVGDSGLGKSPLLYQAAICVAAGVPFLERPIRKGRVLWMDCENGLGQVNGMLESISRFLGLAEVPPDLLLWNLNDAGEDFGATGHQFQDLVRHYAPTWVIIDTLKTMFVGIETKNETATAVYKALRKLMADLQCSITGVHHPRKANDLGDD
jgi:RecA-family ATPase